MRSRCRRRESRAAYLAEMSLQVLAREQSYLASTVVTSRGVMWDAGTSWMDAVSATGGTDAERAGATGAGEMDADGEG